MDGGNVERIIATVEGWQGATLDELGDRGVFGSDELYLLAGREFPAAKHYGDFAQVENGVGAVTALRKRVLSGVSALPRLDGKRIGVVTGVSMGPLMPPLLAALERQTGATFSLIVMENSLFGPTTTTAGLLVGADIRRALENRADLDVALIPAATINDNGLFLDEEQFIALRETMPMPVYPSYDFIDVLALEGEPGLPGRRAA